MGFEPINTNDYIKGDVAVFQNYEGGSEAGHIQMYNGERWVSVLLHLQCGGNEHKHL